MLPRWLTRAAAGWRRPQLALVALVLVVLVGYGINALRDGGSTNAPSATSAPSRVAPPTISTAIGPAEKNTAAASGAVALSSLPAQVTATVRLIKAGGPFPYSQDGVVFSNNEGLLPSHPHGYYHEYTVPTPGASDRATRRIVTGSAGEYFYTGDHYVTFHRIDLTR
jgi:ribonuclease T1